MAPSAALAAPAPEAPVLDATPALDPTPAPVPAAPRRRGGAAGRLAQVYLNRRALGFFGFQAAVVAGVVATGWSWSGLLLAVGLYYARMLFITAAQHRYFSHRAFKTSRPFQLFLAFASMTALQKGVLWWAAHHRRHHRFSDQATDPHSPRDGFWWSHFGWFLAPEADGVDRAELRDLHRFPELRWLDRHELVPGVVFALACLALGGWHGLLWGFGVSTVLLFHGTYLVNSLAHRLGRRRFQTTDDSRNSALIALLTCGEGWHNNHHHYQSSAHQGFRWWELDPSYYLIRLWQALGLVWDVRVAPDGLRG